MFDETKNIMAIFYPSSPFIKIIANPPISQWFLNIMAFISCPDKLCPQIIVLTKIPGFIITDFQNIVFV